MNIGEVVRSPNPLGPIYRPNQRTKMPLWHSTTKMAKLGYKGPIQPVTSTRPSLTSSSCDLRDDATYTTCRCSSASFETNWETLARLASRWSKLLDFFVCPAPFSSCRFCGATDKPSPAWFWGPNHETVAIILRHKSPNRSYQFWVPNQGTRRPWFWGSIKKPADLGFEAQPRNTRFSSPCAWCRTHTTSPDLLIVWPLSTRPVLDHHRSSASGLLLLARSLSLPPMSHLSPTHHETSKHDSLHEHIGVKQPKYPGFKFIQQYVNDSSQSNKGTDHLFSQKVLM
jgi:hypothetical protein